MNRTIYTPREAGIEITVEGYQIPNLRCGITNGDERCDGEIVWESGVDDDGGGSLICCVCHTWYYASAVFLIGRDTSMEDDND
jgi:hypothetical protein